MSLFGDDFNEKKQQLVDLSAKELAIRKEKVEREFEEVERRTKSKQKWKPVDFSNPEFIDLDAAAEAHIVSLSENLPFLNPELSKHIPVSKGLKCLIGAISGTGKTTVAAAMTYEVLCHSPHTKVLLISNEERKEHFQFRLGCMAADLDMMDFMSGKLSPTDRQRVVAAANIYQQRVQIERSDKSTSVNGVMEILQTPGIEQFSLVILDYYQGLSRLNETDIGSKVEGDKVKILDNFKQRVTALNNTYPLVIFSQLKIKPTDQSERDVEERIKWCKAIYEACDTVLEAINIPSMKAMQLFVQKGRWGESYRTYNCKFSKGRFFYLTDDEYEAHLAQKTKEKIDAKNAKLIESISSTPTTGDEPW